MAVGKAKTQEAGEVTYIACHFIDDQWNLHKFVLDAFVEDTRQDAGDVPILGVGVFLALADVTDLISGHADRLSMVAYDITDSDFHPALKNYIDDINSDANLGYTATTYVDIVLHFVTRCLLPPSFTTGIFRDMKNLNLTRQERLQLVSELDLDLEWAFDES